MRCVACRYQGVAPLCSALGEESCQISHLNLAWNNIGNEGGARLGWAMHGNMSLQSLDMAYNSIHARAAYVLAVGLQNHPHIVMMSTRAVTSECSRGWRGLTHTLPFPPPPDHDQHVW